MKVRAEGWNKTTCKQAYSSERTSLSNKRKKITSLPDRARTNLVMSM